MTDVTPPTPEQVAAAQAVIQANNAAQYAAALAEAEAKLGPLIQLGLGVDTPLPSIKDFLAGLDAAMPGIRDYDRTLYNCMEHTIIQLTNLNDRVKTLGQKFT